MDTYSLLREFADSWVLLAMFAFFIGAAIWAFLPSQSKARDEASMIPLRDDPVATEASTPTAAPKGSDDG
jgi:cytochrome c oxidase cbb3-type subunit 4